MYSLTDIHTIILEKSDKIGSDYFPLDVVRNRFILETHRFIDALIPVIEGNQTVSDAIKPLVIPKKYDVLDDLTLGGVIASLPKDYYHLLRVKPIYISGTTPRDVKMLRHGAVEINEADPFNKPTISYPHITQYADYIHVNTGGDEKPVKVLYIYIKKPTYATLIMPSNRIVNLPDNSIDKIIDATVISLFGTTADQRVNLNADKI